MTIHDESPGPMKVYAVEPATLHALARRAEQGAIAKGWDPCSWANLPGKLMMAVTEFDETQQAAINGEDAATHEEIADIAIRLLAARAACEHYAATHGASA